MATIPIYNPVTPFLGKIPGGLRPSLMVRIKGKIHSNGRCTIDFVNSPALNSNQDIMFHVSIRPQVKAIVRNHFQNGNWANEERDGPCKIKNNETFEIVILAEMQHYKIAVNGHHIGVFRHRLPLSLVQFINVAGEVTIDHILLEQDTFSVQPPSFVPVQPIRPTPYQPFGQPPNYLIQQQISGSSITRVGGQTIERRTESGHTVVITKQSHSNHSMNHHHNF